MAVSDQITLTSKQNIAKNDALKWFNGQETGIKDPNRVFTIAGYAGSGKTTLVNVIIEEMNLSDIEVVFVAYTGMASNVLMQKGNKNVMTIHKLIYNARPMVNSIGIVTGFDFQLKDELDNPNIKLIVVDEVSMVNEKMIDELKRFGIKIMALGDPGQLEPIAGINAMLTNPDIFLDEIMRQALDNPIIWISMLARQGKRLPFGIHGDAVQIIRNHEITEDMLYNSDQILAGKNKTVKALNQYYRKEILEIADPFPVVGDKLICLKNDWNYSLSENGLDTFLVNGLMGELTSIQNQSKPMLYKIGFRPKFIENDEFPKLFVDKLLFANDKVRESINPKQLYVYRKPIIDAYGVQEFQYGYAVTVHKFQGSEANNVMVFNEILNYKLHKKWLYTALTRSKEKLILAM